MLRGEVNGDKQHKVKCLIGMLESQSEHYYQHWHDCQKIKCHFWPTAIRVQTPFYQGKILHSLARCENIKPIRIVNAVHIRKQNDTFAAYMDVAQSTIGELAR